MKLAQQDKGAGSWQQKKFDDTDWATMDVPGYWQENGIRIKGTIWYRKEFRVPDSMVGRHARLYMGRMVDSDSVFVMELSLVLLPILTLLVNMIFRQEF